MLTLIYFSNIQIIDYFKISIWLFHAWHGFVANIDWSGIKFFEFHPFARESKWQFENKRMELGFLGLKLCLLQCQNKLNRMGKKEKENKWDNYAYSSAKKI